MKQIAILVIAISIIILGGIWELSYLKESSNYFRLLKYSLWILRYSGILSSANI